MKIFQGFDSLPAFRTPAVTIGSFDGVHLGHRALIERLVAEARAMDGESIVLTFEPHPRVALGHAEGLRLLSTFEEKVVLLERMGVDNLIVIPFDGVFSALSAAEFVREHLLGRLGARVLIVGFNHRFGHDRVAFSTSEKFEGLKVVRVDECNVAGEHVSSTVIRRLLEEGHTKEAERLLGHPLKID